MSSELGTAAVSKKTLGWLEGIAVGCSLLYTILYIYGWIICWFFALVGAGVFVYLCWHRQIFAEVFLQGFYVLFAVYGFAQQWGQSTGVFSSMTVSVGGHLAYIAGGLILLAVVGWGLRQYTTAQLPFVDAFTTIFSLLATWLMVNFVHENWLYWIAIDTVAVFLYFKREMKWTAALYVVYTLLAIRGYFGPIIGF